MFSSTISTITELNKLLHDEENRKCLLATTQNQSLPLVCDWSSSRATEIETAAQTSPTTVPSRNHGTPLKARKKWRGSEGYPCLIECVPSYSDGIGKLYTLVVRFDATRNLYDIY